MGSCSLPSLEFFCPRMHYGARIYFDFFGPLMAKNIRRDIRLPSERKAFSPPVSLFCAKPNTHSALFVSSESVFFPSRSRKPSVCPSIWRRDLLHFVPELGSQKRSGVAASSVDGQLWLEMDWMGQREREREIQIRRKMAKSGGGGRGECRWRPRKVVSLAFYRDPRRMLNGSELLEGFWANIIAMKSEVEAKSFKFNCII